MHLGIALLTALAFWSVVEVPSAAGLRGLAAGGGGVVWVGGSGGSLLRSPDRGKSWRSTAPTEAAGLDFRDIEVLGSDRVIALAAGPGGQSRLYRSLDAGVSWEELYRGRTPETFLDAVAFADERHGYVLGDPIGGRFLLLVTTDGGATWSERPGPPAAPGEAAFASSGTCLAARGERVFVATGGTAARMHRSEDGGATWQAFELPLVHGSASSGAFSVAFADGRHGVVVGGDYQKPGEGGAVAAVTDDGGLTWRLATRPPRGYRSAVAYVPGSGGRELLAVGTTGTDRSSDGGLTWTALDDAPLNAVAIAPDGMAWAAGPDGRVRRAPRP